MGGMRPRWIVAFQVHNAAGFGFSRRLDAVVLDTWPSQGLTVHGLEIKTRKSDMRRELLDPAKAQAFATDLDLFSIAAPAGASGGGVSSSGGCSMSS